MKGVTRDPLPVTRTLPPGGSSTGNEQRATGNDL